MTEVPDDALKAISLWDRTHMPHAITLGWDIYYTTAGTLYIGASGSSLSYTRMRDTARRAFWRSYNRGDPTAIAATALLREHGFAEYMELVAWRAENGLLPK